MVNAQAGCVSDEALWAANERLRAENDALWDAWAAAEQVSEAKQRSFAATGAAMGLGLAQIVTLLAIVVSARSSLSRAPAGR